MVCATSRWKNTTAYNSALSYFLFIFRRCCQSNQRLGMDFQLAKDDCGWHFRGTHCYHCLISFTCSEGTSSTTIHPTKVHPSTGMLSKHFENVIPLKAFLTECDFILRLVHLQCQQTSKIPWNIFVLTWNHPGNVELLCGYYFKINGDLCVNLTVSVCVCPSLRLTRIWLVHLPRVYPAFSYLFHLLFNPHIHQDLFVGFAQQITF